MKQLFKKGIGILLGMSMIASSLVAVSAEEPTTEESTSGAVTIEYTSADDLTKAGVTIGEFNVYTETQPTGENAPSYGTFGATNYNNATSLRPNFQEDTTKTNIVIEIPEGKRLETFWLDYVRNGADNNGGIYKIYASDKVDGEYDELMFSGRSSILWDTTGFELSKDSEGNDITRSIDHWSVNKTQFSYRVNNYKGIDKDYRFVKIVYPEDKKTNGYANPEYMIGQMGYTWKTTTDGEKSVDIYYKSQAELEAQGVIYTGATGATLTVERHNYSDDSTDHSYQMYSNGVGELTIQAPEGKVFTKFWAECLNGAENNFRISFSNDGTNYTKPVDHETPVVSFAPYWSNMTGNTASYSADAGNGYKYVKIQLSTKDGADASYNYGMIRQMGYTCVDEPTSGNVEITYNNIQDLTGRTDVEYIGKDNAELQWDGNNNTVWSNGVGYLVVKVPEGKVFTSFSARFFESKERLRISFSKTGKQDDYTDPIYPKLLETEEKNVQITNMADDGYRYVRIHMSWIPGEHGGTGMEETNTEYFALFDKLSYSWAYDPILATTTANEIKLRNTTDNEKSAQVIAAVYKDDDLVAVKVNPVTISAKRSVTVTHNLDTANGDTIRYFVWDDFTSLKPLLTVPAVKLK